MKRAALAVHPHRADVEQEVEVEPAQLLGREHVERRCGRSAGPTRLRTPPARRSAGRRCRRCRPGGSTGRRCRPRRGVAPLGRAAAGAPRGGRSAQGRARRAGLGPGAEGSPANNAESTCHNGCLPVSPTMVVAGMAPVLRERRRDVTTTVFGLSAARTPLTSWSTSSDVSRLHAPHPSPSLTTSSPTPTATSRPRRPERRRRPLRLRLPLLRRPRRRPALVHLAQRRAARARPGAAPGLAGHLAGRGRHRARHPQDRQGGRRPPPRARRPARPGGRGGDGGQALPVDRPPHLPPRPRRTPRAAR